MLLRVLRVLRAVSSHVGKNLLALEIKTKLLDKIFSTRARTHKPVTGVTRLLKDRWCKALTVLQVCDLTRNRPVTPVTFIVILEHVRDITISF